VLSAGTTPHTPLAEWSFTIHGAVAEPVSWSWGEFPAPPSETITTDIHCVTEWSKLDTSWRGVSLDTLLEAVDTSAGYHRVLGRRLQQPGASGRHRRARVGGLRVRRRAACPRARRSATAGPARVLLEERRVGARADADRRRSARLLGGVRLPQARRPMARAATSETELAHRHPRRGDRRNPPGQDPHLRRARLGRSPRGSIDVRLTAEDGDQAPRSCSVASAPEDERLALTVEILPDGEVSPPGRRARAGRSAGAARVDRQLPRMGAGAGRPGAAGPRRLGRGALARDAAPPRRRPQPRRDAAPVLRAVASDLVYGQELSRLADVDPGVDVQLTVTRHWPANWNGHRGQIDRGLLERSRLGRRRSDR